MSRTNCRIEEIEQLAARLCSMAETLREAAHESRAAGIEHADVEFAVPVMEALEGWTERVGSELRRQSIVQRARQRALAAAK